VSAAAAGSCGGAVAFEELQWQGVLWALDVVADAVSRFPLAFAGGLTFVDRSVEPGAIAAVVLSGVLPLSHWLHVTWVLTARRCVQVASPL
jgi:hypothetical protein